MQKKIYFIIGASLVVLLAVFSIHRCNQILDAPAEQLRGTDTLMQTNDEGNTQHLIANKRQDSPSAEKPGIKKKKPGENKSAQPVSVDKDSVSQDGGEVPQEIIITKRQPEINFSSSVKESEQTNNHEPDYFIEFKGQDEGSWVKIKITNQVVKPDDNHVLSKDGRYVYVRMK